MKKRWLSLLAPIAAVVGLALPATALATVTTGLTMPTDGTVTTTLSWAGISSPTKYDEVDVKTSTGTLVWWGYTGTCTHTLPTAGAASGTCSVDLPTGDTTYDSEQWHGTATSQCASGPPGSCTLKATSSWLIFLGPALSASAVMWAGDGVQFTHSHIWYPTTSDVIKIYDASTNALVNTIYPDSCTTTSYSTATATGNCTTYFGLTTADHSYYAKYYGGDTLASNPSYQATTASFTVVHPTLTTSVTSGTSTARVSWWSDALPDSPDKVHVYNSANTEIDWFYTDSCTHTMGSSDGGVSGYCDYKLPSTGGTYYFKTYSNYYSGWEATSANVTITPASVSAASTTPPSTSSTVTFSGVLNKATTDKIEVFNAANTQVNWVYTNSCTQTAGGTAVASGSCSIALPGGGGTYTFKLYADANVEATSSAVTVSPATIAATLHSPDGSYNVTSTVDVAFSNALNPSTTDKIKVYTSATAADSSSVDWFYANSCTQTAGGTAVTSGSCNYNPTSAVGSGYFEFRLFETNADSSSVAVVTSNAMLNLIPTFGEEANYDGVLFVSFDGWGFFHPTNQANSSIWPQNCGTPWDFCAIPWTGAAIPNRNCYYGDITANNSSNCLAPEVSGSMTSGGPAQWEGDRSNTNYVEYYEFPALVSLPDGALMTAHLDSSNNVDGYTREPDYSTAITDGYSACDAAGHWCGSVLLPVLPKPYLGDNTSCGCEPGDGSGSQSDPVDTSQTISSPPPHLIEIDPSEDLYIYDSASGGYLLIPTSGVSYNNNNGTTYGKNQRWSNLIKQCASTNNPYLYSQYGVTYRETCDTDGNPAIHFPAVPLAKTGQVHDQETYPLDCYSDLFTITKVSNTLTPKAEYACDDGQPPYNSPFAVVCIQKLVGTVWFTNTDACLVTATGSNFWTEVWISGPTISCAGTGWYRVWTEGWVVDDAGKNDDVGPVAGGIREITCA